MSSGQQINRTSRATAANRAAQLPPFFPEAEPSVASCPSRPSLVAALCPSGSSSTTPGELRPAGSRSMWKTAAALGSRPTSTAAPAAARRPPLRLVLLEVVLLEVELHDGAAPLRVQQHRAGGLLPRPHRGGLEPASSQAGSSSISPTAAWDASAGRHTASTILLGSANRCRNTHPIHF